MSEIEPELLFAVERRMQGDAWHHGRFTVVPRVSENTGLNFLDRSAQEYLSKVGTYLAARGLRPDRPLAFLCNPPYRSDDDQAAESADYDVHPSIVELTGADAARERYCCFLAQMKLICEAAQDSGLPDDSLLLLFTKSAWLTRRSIFEGIRSELLSCFEDIGGILVDGSQFFQIKGKWPVAFTMWRFRGRNAGLESKRTVQVLDLTWVTKRELSAINWGQTTDVEARCQSIYSDARAQWVELGTERTSIREWTGETMVDFKRARRKAEIGRAMVGGLPTGDARQGNTKAYGEVDGQFIGFMDDLTPCRVRRSVADRPWFRLNSQFMDIKKNRCLSGPPTHWGYCAAYLEPAKKLFFWYSLARTFLQHPYPMWVDADDLWAPNIAEHMETAIFQVAFAIAYAENECVNTQFPYDNPVQGAPEIAVRNPLTPLNDNSFWSTTLAPFCRDTQSEAVRELIESVDDLYEEWKLLFRNRSEIPITEKPYVIGHFGLTSGAGIVQIRDYAREDDNNRLQTRLGAVHTRLRTAKAEFFQLATSSTGLNYFGARRKPVSSAKDPMCSAEAVAI